MQGTFWSGWVAHGFFVFLLASCIWTDNRYFAGKYISSFRPITIWMAFIAYFWHMLKNITLGNKNTFAKLLFKLSSCQSSLTSRHLSEALVSLLLSPFFDVTMVTGAPEVFSPVETKFKGNLLTFRQGQISWLTQYYWQGNLGY